MKKKSNKKIKNFIYISVIIGLISSNVMSITNAKFHDLLSNLFSKAPIADFMSQSKAKQVKTLSKENKQLKKQNSAFKKEESLRKVKLAKAQKITRKVALRTAKNVSLNVSSIVGESVPYVGIGVILAVTVSDVYAGCETIKDTNELLTLMDFDGVTNEESNVCGVTVPTEQQVRDSLKGYKREIDDIVGRTIYEILN